MKKIIVPLIICVAIFGSMLSCRKNDNPKLGPITSVPLLNFIDTANDRLIPDTGAFTRTFTVDLYYKSDVKPKSIDIVIVKNGAKTNYNDSSIKILQAGVTTFPSAITFTNISIVNLFGSIALGDIYEFGANITLQNGTVIPGFIVGDSNLKGGSDYGSDIAQLPGENYIVTYKSPCAYNQSILTGTYKIIRDDWQDYVNLPQPVPPVTPGPAANQITLMVYPGAAAGTNAKPMIVTIDTLNAGGGNATVANQIIGDYPGAGATNATAQTNVADANNSFVDFCTGEIHLELDFTLPNGPNAGTYPGNVMDITH
jgi:hypothetical protein